MITPRVRTSQSPTMTEGSISEWKVKEGEAFAAGDVLLSLETDKATIDVEAQDDGLMGKILVRHQLLPRGEGSMRARRNRHADSALSRSNRSPMAPPVSLSAS